MPRLRRILIALIFLVPPLTYCTGNLLIYFVLYSPVHQPICCETPADWGFDYQEVSFPSRDNLVLKGWYIPSQHGVSIVTLHGYDGNRLSHAPVIQLLAESGYGVLTYDMRGHGESGGERRSLGWQDVPDVQGAVDFLQSQNDDEIGIWGHSIGGQVAVRAAAQIPDIKAIVLDGASTAFYSDIGALVDGNLFAHILSYDLYLMNFVFSRFLLQMPIPAGIKASLPQITPRPILLIGGTADSVEATLIRDFYAVADDPKTLLEFSDVGHGGAWLVHRDEYGEALLQFYDSAFIEK